MIKRSKIRRQTVPLQPARPSRIRREPPVRAEDVAAARRAWDPSTWETWVVVTGVVMFAVALSIIMFGVSDFVYR